MGQPRRPGARTRSYQRRLHLLAALPVIAYVYLAPELDAAVTSAVRWALVPALALSGIAMWQWPRARRPQRRTRPRADVTERVRTAPAGSARP